MCESVRINQMREKLERELSEQKEDFMCKDLETRRERLREIWGEKSNREAQQEGEERRERARERERERERVM